MSLFQEYPSSFEFCNWNDKECHQFVYVRRREHMYRPTWAGLCGWLGVYCVIVVSDGTSGSLNHTHTGPDFTKQSIFSCFWRCIHCMSAQSQGSDSAECLWPPCSSEGPFCQTVLCSNTDEVSFWFPAVWDRSCLACWTSWARHTGRRSSNVHDTWEAMRAGSLLNIDWTAKQWGRGIFAIHQPPPLYLL